MMQNKPTLMGVMCYPSDDSLNVIDAHQAIHYAYRFPENDSKGVRTGSPSADLGSPHLKDYRSAI